MALGETPVASDPTEATDNGSGRARTRTRKTKRYRPASKTKGRENGGGVTLSDIRDALLDLEAGQFATRLPEEGEDLLLEIAEVFNRVAEKNDTVCTELGRISRTVGREGKMNDRARVDGLHGGWKSKIDAVNNLIT